MKGERIIVADDNENVRRFIPIALEKGGHKVVAKVGSVGEAQGLNPDSFKEKPTLAIVDGSMPNEGDGQQAAEILRSKFPEIAIVAFSSREQSWGDLNLMKATISN